MEQQAMVLLRILLIGLMASFVVSCAAPPLAPVSARRDSLAKMDPVRIQADTMGFADRFVTAMTGVYNEVERNAVTPGVRDAAHQLKTDLALGAISNAVNPRPIAGMIDMVVLVTLLRQIAEDPWTTRTFGADAVRILAALRAQEADIRVLAGRYLTDSQLRELDELAQRWHRTHPDDRSVSHVHLANLPDTNRTPEAPGRSPGNASGIMDLVFDLNDSLEPAVREMELSRATSERMFFYLQRMPLLLQLQTESFYRRLFETPEVRQTLADMSSAANSAAQLTQTGSRFTDAVERLPEQLAAERERAIHHAGAEIAMQRDLMIRQLSDATATHRDATIKQLSDTMDIQRELALTQGTRAFAAQRDEAIAALGLEQQAFVTSLGAAVDRSVDRLLTRFAVLGICLLILFLGITYGLGHYARRWWRGGVPPVGHMLLAVGNKTSGGATITTADGSLQQNGKW